MLAARIDRLAPEQKSTLEAASVIGKEFSAALLARVGGFDAAVLEQALRALVAAEFISERTRPEPTYAFRHPLTQEVAYSSQLRERRRLIHAAAAAAIIEEMPDQLDERAALIARHWDLAGEQLEAARWHAQAATWSGYNDPAESVRHWRRVCELAGELPETDETIALGLAARVATLHFGWRLGLSGEEAESLFEEAERMAAKAGDVRWRVLLLGGYGAVKGMGQGAIGEYASLARDALALVEEAGDPSLYMPPNAYAFFLTGDLQEGLAVLDRAIDATGGDPMVGAGMPIACPLALCLSQKGAFLTMLGELEAAHVAIEQGGAMALEQGDLETLAHYHGFASRLAYVEGDASSTLDTGKKASRSASGSATRSHVPGPGPTSASAR